MDMSFLSHDILYPEYAYLLFVAVPLTRSVASTEMDYSCNQWIIFNWLPTDKKLGRVWLKSLSLKQ